MNLLLVTLIASILGVNGVPFTPMEFERLPEMNIPRMVHSLHDTGGEFVVIGGHTTGFVPTQTAEYYRRGRWHTIPMLYTHDAGFTSTLPDGDILVGGGYHEAFGIGQTWGVEVYHPGSHSFSYLPILSHKRAQATALRMDDGRILVAGNWYAPDCLECSANGEPFSEINQLTVPRNLPYLLQVSDGNAYIFGGSDNYGNVLGDGWVDQLEGEPFQEPLLQEWIPEFPHQTNPPEHYQTGTCRYLIPVRHDDQLALMLLENGRFRLLETVGPIPMESPWGAIDWMHGLNIEASSGSAWKRGRDADGRLYLLRIAYGETLAGLEVFYSEPIADLPHKPEGLALPGGRYLLTGGCLTDAYDAQGTVLMCYTQGKTRGNAYWMGLAAGMISALLLVLLGWYLSRKKKVSEPEARSAQAAAPDLQADIVRLMEEEQLFRNPDLRIADFAARLHTNTTYISACVNSRLGMSFPRFVTLYRIRYAKDQLSRYPDKKLSVISDEAGFANENSFFRTFKAETGLSPAQWRAQRNNT